VRAGAAPARQLAHARILLKADQAPGGPGWRDQAIAQAVEVSRATVERVRKRFARDGLEAALVHRPPRATKPRTLDGRQEAQLVALVCSGPPPGRERWSLRLLADKLVELEVVEAVSHETVRQVLKQTS
jgi:transposase